MRALPNLTRLEGVAGTEWPVTSSLAAAAHMMAMLRNMKGSMRQIAMEITAKTMPAMPNSAKVAFMPLGACTQGHILCWEEPRAKVHAQDVGGPEVVLPTRTSCSHQVALCACASWCSIACMEGNLDS